MQYEVQAVEAHELPEGTDVVIVERGDGTAVMLVAGRPSEVWTAMRAWEDSHEAPEIPSLLYVV